MSKNLTVNPPKSYVCASICRYVVTHDIQDNASFYTLYLDWVRQSGCLICDLDLFEYALTTMYNMVTVDAERIRSAAIIDGIIPE